MNRMRFLMLLGFLAIAAGFSAVIMLLWNWLMPAIFGLVSIGFWQAFGILALCRLLFGSFGGGHRRTRRGREEGYSRSPIREKWMKMTPEQREKFIQRRKDYFGRCGFFGGRDFDFDAGKDTPLDDSGATVQQDNEAKK